MVARVLLLLALVACAAAACPKGTQAGTSKQRRQAEALGYEVRPLHTQIDKNKPITSKRDCIGAPILRCFYFAGVSIPCKRRLQKVSRAPRVWRVEDVGRG